MSDDVNHDLLRAICDNPDDDALRASYADWVEEKDPARAEFIRVQLEIAQLRNDNSTSEALFEYFIDEDRRYLNWIDWKRVDPGVDRRHALHKRQKYLWGRNRKRWRENEGVPKKGISTLEMERGFYASGTLLGTKSLLENADELFQRAPIQRLDKDQLKVDHVKALLQTEALGRLRALDSYLGEEAWEVIGNSPQVAGVQELQVSKYRSQEAARYIAGCDQWKSLKRFASVPVDDAGVFFPARHLKSLTHLRLLGNFETQQIRYLAESGFDRLVELDFDVPLSDDCLEILASANCLRQLRKLGLDYAPVAGRNPPAATQHGLIALLASPVLKNLSILGLANNAVGRVDKGEMQQLPPTALKVLELSGFKCKKNDLGGISHCPALNEVIQLNLFYRKLHNKTVRDLVDGDQLKNLAALDLR